MKKKSLVLPGIVLFAALVIGLLYGLNSSSNGKVLDTLVNRVNKIRGVDSSPVPANSITGRLKSSTLAMFSFYPRQLDSGVERFKSFARDVLNSELLNDEDLLAQASDEGLKDKLAELKELLASDQRAESGEGEELSFPVVWNDLSEVVAAVSEDTFVVTEGAEFPKVMLVASFLSENFVGKLFSAVDANVNSQQGDSLANFAGVEGFSVEAVPGTKSFRLLFKDEDKEVVSAGKILFEKNAIEFLLGAEDKSDFLTPAGGAVLTQSAEWKKVSQGAAANSAFVFFLRFGKFSLALREFFEKLAEKYGGEFENFSAQMNPAFDAWNGVGPVFGSAYAEDMIRSRQCISFVGDSVTRKNYGRLISVRNTPNSNPEKFYRLINERTTTAYAVSGGYLEFIFKVFSQNFENVDLKNTPGYDDIKPMIAAANKLVAAIKDLSFQEIGFVFDAPKLGPLPELGIYFGLGKKPAVEAMETLETIINDLSVQIGGTKILFLENKGTEDVKIKASVGSGPGLVGKPVSDRSIVIGLNEFYIARAARMLSGEEKAYLREKKLGEVPLADSLSSSDFIYYLGGRAGITWLQPYLNILGGMGAVPEMENKLEKIRAFTDLFAGDIISLQNTYANGPDVFCTDLSLAALH